jgi:gluconokinase
MIPKDVAFAVIVMGVSGCGKTTVGERMAEALGFVFVEGDLLHPLPNVEKMRNGAPLDDEDRWPWLDRIGAEALALLSSGKGVVLSCSALKHSYRDRLRRLIGQRLHFVFLWGTYDVLRVRISSRRDHFMPLGLLESQLEALEVPDQEPDVIAIDIDQHISSIVDEAVNLYGGESG